MDEVGRKRVLQLAESGTSDELIVYANDAHGVLLNRADATEE